MKDLDRWIIWYNEKRIKESLMGLSPKDYRIKIIVYLKTHQPWRMSKISGSFQYVVGDIGFEPMTFAL